MWRRNQRLAEGQSPDFSSRGHRPRSQMSSEGEIFVGIELSYSATPELLQLLNSCSRSLPRWGGAADLSMDPDAFQDAEGEQHQHQK